MTRLPASVSRSLLSRLTAGVLLAVLVVSCDVAGQRGGETATTTAQTYNQLARLDTETYDAFGPILQVADSTLLIAYRQGRTHVSNDGIVAGRLSTNLGQTWGDPFLIFNDLSTTVRGVGGGIRIAGDDFLLFHRRGESLEAVRSQDGKTWTNPETVYHPEAEDVLMFGNPIYTNPSTIMRGFYSFGESQTVNVTFSQNRGRSWEEPKTVLRSSSVEHSYNEASYVALDDTTILGLVRDEMNTAFTQVRSTNGGRDWSNEGPVPFTYGDRPHPPFLMRISNPGQQDWIVCLYAHRSKKELRMIGAPREALLRTGTDAWKYRQVIRFGSFTRARSGYPYAVQVESNGRVVGWYYDEVDADDADIVVFSLNPLQELRGSNTPRLHTPASLHMPASFDDE